MKDSSDCPLNPLSKLNVGGSLSKDECVFKDYTVAYRDGLTPSQVKKLLKFVLKNFLGNCIINEAELVEYFNKKYHCCFELGQFNGVDGNVVEVLDDSDEVLEQYQSCADKDTLLRYVKCLDMIKKGYCISIGEYIYPTLEYLQKEFWSAMENKDKFYKL